MSEFGLIETIKVVDGRPVFKNLHVRRLVNSLRMINVEVNEYRVEDRILRLLKYECIEKGLKNFRLRIEVQKNRMHDYLPEIGELKWNCVLSSLESTRFTWNERGLKLTILPKHKKLLDRFANLKHSERAIYQAALNYARENNFDEALVLNEKDNVTDASIYNVFIVQKGKVFTPPLEDGSVAGVLRELLLSRLPETRIIERSLTLKDICQAEEIFLTNAIRGIRWVEYLDDQQLGNTITRQIFREFSAVVAEQFGEHLV